MSLSHYSTDFCGTCSKNHVILKERHKLIPFLPKIIRGKFINTDPSYILLHHRNLQFLLDTGSCPGAGIVGALCEPCEAKSTDCRRTRVRSEQAKQKTPIKKPIIRIGLFFCNNFRTRLFQTIREFVAKPYLFFSIT